MKNDTTEIVAGYTPWNLITDRRLRYGIFLLLQRWADAIKHYSGYVAKMLARAGVVVDISTTSDFGFNGFDVHVTITVRGIDLNKFAHKYKSAYKLLKRLQEAYIETYKQVYGVEPDYVPGEDGEWVPISQIKAEKEAEKDLNSGSENSESGDNLIG